MLSSPDLSQSLPNPAWHMPQTGQHLLLYTFGGLCVVFVAYCAWYGHRNRTWLPLCIAAGAMASIMLEPVADTLGNVTYGSHGQITAFVVDGQPVPWFVVVAYTWYYGLLPILLWRKFRDRTMTPSLWWKIAGGAFLSVWLFEQIPSGTGMWIYYGHQPLRIGNMPMWMAFANYASVTCVGLVLYRIWPLLKGWKSALAIPLIPATVLATWTASAIPAIMVLNAPPKSVSWTESEIAGLVCLGFSILVVFLGIVFAHNLIPDAAPQVVTEPDPARDRTRQTSAGLARQATPVAG